MKKILSKTFITLFCIFSLISKPAVAFSPAGAGIAAGVGSAAKDILIIAGVATVSGALVVTGLSYGGYKTYNKVKSDLKKPLWRCGSSNHVKPVYIRTFNKPLDKNLYNCARQK